MTPAMTFRREAIDLPREGLRRLEWTPSKDEILFSISGSFFASWLGNALRHFVDIRQIAERDLLEGWIRLEHKGVVRHVGLPFLDAERVLRSFTDALTGNHIFARDRFCTRLD